MAGEVYIIACALIICKAQTQFCGSVKPSPIPKSSQTSSQSRLFGCSSANIPIPSTVACAAENVLSSSSGYNLPQFQYSSPCSGPTNVPAAVVSTENQLNLPSSCLQQGLLGCQGSVNVPTFNGFPTGNSFKPLSNLPPFFPQSQGLCECQETLNICPNVPLPVNTPKSGVLCATENQLNSPSNCLQSQGTFGYQGPVNLPSFNGLSTGNLLKSVPNLPPSFPQLGSPCDFKETLDVCPNVPNLNVPAPLLNLPSCFQQSLGLSSCPGPVNPSLCSNVLKENVLKPQSCVSSCASQVQSVNVPGIPLLQSSPGCSVFEPLSNLPSFSQVQSSLGGLGSPNTLVSNIGLVENLQLSPSCFPQFQGLVNNPDSCNNIPVQTSLPSCLPSLQRSFGSLGSVNVPSLPNICVPENLVPSSQSYLPAFQNTLSCAVPSLQPVLGGQTSINVPLAESFSIPKLQSIPSFSTAASVVTPPSPASIISTTIVDNSVANTLANTLQLLVENSVRQPSRPCNPASPIIPYNQMVDVVTPLVDTNPYFTTIVDTPNYYGGVTEVATLSNAPFGALTSSLFGSVSDIIGPALPSIYGVQEVLSPSPCSCGGFQNQCDCTPDVIPGYYGDLSQVSPCAIESNPLALNNGFSGFPYPFPNLEQMLFERLFEAFNPRPFAIPEFLAYNSGYNYNDIPEYVPVVNTPAVTADIEVYSPAHSIVEVISPTFTEVLTPVPSVPTYTPIPEAIPISLPRNPYEESLVPVQISCAPLVAELIIPSSIPAKLVCSIENGPSSLPVVNVCGCYF